MSIARFIERVRTRLYLEYDMRRWRRSVTGLRRTKTSSATKSVLICDLVANIATAKIEALLGQFLRFRGYKVVVLLSCRRPEIETAYRAVYEPEFIYLDEIVSPAMARSAAAGAEDLIATADTLAALVGIEVDGIRVGRNALSWVTRCLRTGRVDVTDAAHRKLIEETLSASLAAIAAGRQLLDGLKLDLALFIERGYTPAGELFDLCLTRGIDTVQWLGAPQSGSFLFKRYSMENRADHPLALAPQSWDEISSMAWPPGLETRLMEKLASNYKSGAWFNRQQLQTNTVFKTREEIITQLGIDPERKIAVIFAHILYDATFFYGESLFDDYQEWLVESIRTAIANPNLTWLVKVHPVNVWRSKMDGVEMEQLEKKVLADAFGELPDHVKIIPADSDINTYNLFQIIDYGLTVRGTVGLELPCYGIPTVTAGTGRYAGNGFTIDPASPAAFHDTLATLHTVERLAPETVEKARRYAFGTFFLRPIPVSFFELAYNRAVKGVPIYGQNTFVQNPGREDAAEAADMNLIADWMASRHEADLLNRAAMPGPNALND